MRSRSPIWKAERKALRAQRQQTLALVLGKAVEKVIRSKRAILASKVRLAGLRGNRKGIP